MIFQGIWTRIDKEPYVFAIFQGGGAPDPLSPLWIRTWNINSFSRRCLTLLDIILQNKTTHAP